MTPSEVRDAFDGLTESEKIESGLFIKDRKNTSWKTVAPKVKEFALEKKSFFLDDLKKVGIVSKEQTAQAFVRCCIPILLREGFELTEQKQVGPRKTSLFHIKGHAKVIEQKQQTVFVLPDAHAAKFFVKHILNGQSGRVDIRKLATIDIFPFIKNKASLETLRKEIIHEAGSGWKSSRFILIKKEEVRNE